MSNIVIPDYPVLISYSNDGYYHFAKNLLINLNNKIQNHKVHFFCLDEIIYKKLNSEKDSIFNNLDLKLTLIKSKVSNKFENYGSQNYNKITHIKISVIEESLKMYNYVHFIDSDVVCINEPNKDHYDKYRDCDIVFQHDAGFHSSDKLHAPVLNHIWACTGNTSFKNTTGTKKIINIIKTYQKKYNKNDQECLYQYMLDNNITDLSQVKDANLSTYNPEEYTNGYWLNHDIGNLDKTYFFHANHVVGNDNKKLLLKKSNNWFVN